MGHFRCRNGVYPKSMLLRYIVADDAVSWSVENIKYKPLPYESLMIRDKPWADPWIGDPDFDPQFNELDGPVDRRSFTGSYHIINGRPRNPIGRTGIYNRGLLGRWGPNHCADTIVTRWKRVNDDVVKNGDLPILQFCAIQRRDNKEWAIPGGMVDAGESVEHAAVREFKEEALNSGPRNLPELKTLSDAIDEFFTMKNAVSVYKGYVDDPRNTDNAWMETNVFNFHDDTGKIVEKFPLAAGDDARAVKWLDIQSTLKLYASHEDFVQKVTILRGAHY